MKKPDIVRAWRDGEYFAELTEEERAALPENPAALPQIDDDALSSVTGGCSAPTSAFCSPCTPDGHVCY